VLLHFILPGEPIFKFEYQKGAPWKHENLMAPFDFAIMKTDAEIEAEKEELTKNLAPFFRLDTQIFRTQADLFRQEFYSLFDSTGYTDRHIYNRFYTALKLIYANGILQSAPENYESLDGKKEIARLTGNVSTKINTGDVFSEKSAYNYLSEVKIRLNSQYPAYNGKLTAIDLSKYLKANLKYDAETTQKQVDEVEAGISKTRGVVQAGERIILNGELVDAEKFNILESLKTTYEKKRGEGVNKYMITAGKLMLIAIFLLVFFIFLFYYRRDILNQLRRLTFLLLLTVTMVFLSVFANSYNGIHIYIVPIAILPIVVRTFFDSRTAIFTLIISVLIVGLYAPNSFEYVLIQTLGGVIAVFSLAKMHRRVHLVLASLWVLLTYVAAYAAINTIREGSILNIDYRMLQWFAYNCILINLAYPLIYIFEKLFGFISDVTLIEISDTNQPLLRKLAEEAPGTFQHSIQIANLAEEVILKIGGNPFLVRAGALYHDIGKIAKADYFTENQFGIKNPHDRLGFEQSAEIIISHVKSGIKLAKKNKLPESIIEFIATHHGTSKAKYFYLKQKQDYPEKTVDENKFIYPGPLPRTKEAAVVMLIDGIEAASRSMEDKNADNLWELVNRMVDQKVSERQLDQSDLTFRDINTIKKILHTKLLNIYHVRIAYPSEVKKD